MTLHCKKNAALAAYFSAERHSIANAFAEIATVIPRWRANYQSAARSGRLGDFVADEFSVYPNYLENAFCSGDSVWLSLYVGEKIKQSQSDDDRRTAFNGNPMVAVLDGELAHLKRAIEARGLGGEFIHVEQALNSVRGVIATEPSRSLRVLWIADCLYLDIQSFLVPHLAGMSLGLQPDLVTTKNPIERYEQISAFLEGASYDAIFYCPFSYENSQGYSRMMNARRAAENMRCASDVAIAEYSKAEAVIRLLGERSECPIFVHNASGVMRHHGTWKDAVKDIATRPAREQFCQIVNAKLVELMQEINREKPAGQVVVIDEHRIARADGLRSAGAHFHFCGLQHPARLGLLLVEPYLDALYVIQSQLKKKVIVCDLDNTLWDGLIGEGVVSHYLDRQSILKNLRKKGILLAINSKNSELNVRWDGAALSNDDFAASRINWSTKVENIGALAEEMNLNSNSFIFVDDRADERSMVSSAFPEITVLDAEDPATWRRLALWERMMSGLGVMDRTLLYKKRQEREQFISSTPQASKEALFEQLELQCSVSLSDEKSLPRIADLLNRTNQFNTTGRRTTLKEVQSWHRDPDWAIIVGRAKDRFGDMGVVSILVAQRAKSEISIEAFVLSCRVFGYGVETAVLKALIDASPGALISGVIAPTSVNQPCLSVYRTHEFRFEAGRWIHDESCAGLPDRPWLNVDNKVPKAVLGELIHA